MADSREAAVDRMVAIYQPHWNDMTEEERRNAITRIASAAGVSREEAVQRVSNPPCPRCGSTNIERGEVVVCRVCAHVLSV
jgi:predicted RNA-binding Zn-ribbon protein involved in translation (DUF1610 family)